MEQLLNEDGIVGLPDRREMDDRVHGTMVAGTALFGNIEKRLNQNRPLDQKSIYFLQKYSTWKTNSTGSRQTCV